MTRHFSHKLLLSKEIIDEWNTDEAKAEWAALESLEESNKKVVQRLFKQKLDEWKEMKSRGLFEKMQSNGEYDEDSMQEINEIKSNIWKRDNLDLKDFAMIDVPFKPPVDEKKKAVNDILEKLKKYEDLPKNESSLLVYSLLNEIKDKSLFEGPLIQEVMMALSRTDSAQLSTTAFKMTLLWGKQEVLTPSLPSKFFIKYATSCAANGLIETAEAVTTYIEDSETESAASLLPCKICLELQRLSKARKSRGKVIGSAVANKKRALSLSSDFLVYEKECLQRVGDFLSQLISHISEYSVSEINIVIRSLGRRKLTTEIFDLMDAMRASGVEPNDETLEFLANALVYSVEEVATARSMGGLPPANISTPEVLFAGRSNVGKSSLVNMICNRKALASTSATPGHTKQFHFYCVNKDRVDVPSFYLVDVPGLGYAESANNTIDSWRSLLLRYVSVRDSLRSVWHLVDSRHGLTAVDRQVIEMVTNAAHTRATDGKAAFNYTLILTKADKATEKQLRQTRADIAVGTAELVATLGLTGSGVPTVLTSSVSKAGRDGVWRLLQDLIGH